MNKFLAILKDSYREALSTWVIPVMLVLSAILMLFVASISFRPITLKDALDQQFNTFNWAFGLNPNLKGTKFAVENYSGTNEVEPWKSDYQFDVVLNVPKPDVMKQLRENPGFPASRRRMENFLKQSLPQIAELKVTEVKAEEVPAPANGAAPKPTDGEAKPATPEEPKPQEVRYRVTTTGTTVPDRMAWLHEATVLFAFDLPFPTTLRQGVYTLEKRLVNDVGAWVLILVSVIITAGFVPNFLTKGTLDLYITKPIGRVELLIYKYAGGLIFVTFLTGFTVAGVWAVIGLRTGLWTTNFLLLIPVMTFYFAVLYSVSVLAAVLTRSTLVAILATMVMWGLFVLVGWGNDKLNQALRAEQELREKIEQASKPADPEEEADLPRPPNPDRLWKPPAALDYGVSGLYAVLPRAYDLDDRMIQLIADGVLTEAELKSQGRTQALPSWGATLGVSFAFIAVMLSLASWRFVTRDG